jgi:hypothetical protein
VKFRKEYESEEMLRQMLRIVEEKSEKKEDISSSSGNSPPWTLTDVIAYLIRYVANPTSSPFQADTICQYWFVYADWILESDSLRHHREFVDHDPFSVLHISLL